MSAVRHLDLMHRAASAVLAGVAALLILAGCGGGGGGASNTSPTANAGPAQTVVAGAAVTLNGAASSDPDGTIAAYQWTQIAGLVVSLSNAATVQPGFIAPQVTATTTLQFSLVVTDNRGTRSSASTVAITVGPANAGVVTLSGTVRFARVPFASGAPYGLDHANPQLRPSRGVVVRALDAATQAELAVGSTGSDGGYSITLPGNTNILLQVVARMQRDASQPLPRWNVRVQDGQGNLSPHAYTSAAFNSSVGTQNIDIPTGLSAAGSATGPRASGAFAILDTIYTAMQAVLAVAPNTSFPALFVDWGSQTAGTHFSSGASGQYIALMSDLTEDTDEFDQHVVAHEFGHYVEYNFSRSDSIGGSHALGDRLDMRVAFGEGFGYAFAAIVLNDPDARDSFVSGGTQAASRFVVEANPATTGCWCSETSVWSILWDLYDVAPDGSDSITMDFAALWQVMIGPQRTTPAMTSIFSFIEALKAARPGDAAAINALVAAQNIDAAAIDAFASTQTHVPYPNLLPLFASITPGVPVVVRSTDDGGVYNKAGNHRFLRFTPSVTGNVSITVTTSNTSTGQGVAADPDYVVFRSGVPIAEHDSPPSAEPPQTETGQVAVTAGTTYVIDAYDCANGCYPDPVQGVRGDYDLTVTIQ